MVWQPLQRSMYWPLTYTMENSLQMESKCTREFSDGFHCVTKEALHRSIAFLSVSENTPNLSHLSASLGQVNGLYALSVCTDNVKRKEK